MGRLAIAANTDASMRRFLAAWNEPDAVARSRHLEASFSPTGAFVDPTVEVVGRARLLDYIADCRAQLAGGARFDIIGDVEWHHDLVQFGWSVVDADGAKVLEGRCVGELDTWHRFVRLNSFFERAVPSGFSAFLGSQVAARAATSR
jgi:hypothetical protein